MNFNNKELELVERNIAFNLKFHAGLRKNKNFSEAENQVTALSYIASEKASPPCLDQMVHWFCSSEG